MNELKPTLPPRQDVFRRPDGTYPNKAPTLPPRSNISRRPNGEYPSIVPISRPGGALINEGKDLDSIVYPEDK